MLKVKSVMKEFRTRRGNPVVALKDVDLDVHRGEFVTVVGASGSGKSTLLFTVAGMQKPTEGSVLFNDTDLYLLSAAERSTLRRKRIGFIFQAFNLIPYLTCLENVALPAILEGKSVFSSKTMAKKHLERFKLEHRLDHRPSELSIGERQRAAICRSFVNQPDIILADEPTGNLDRNLTMEVAENLKELNAEGLTIIMVTHDLSLSEKGTRVISLDNGVVVEDRPTRKGNSAA